MRKDERLFPIKRRFFLSLRSFFCLSEKAKMHLAVFLHKKEMRMMPEILFAGVFQDEPSPGGQKRITEYHIRQGLYTLQSIRGISEDNIERKGGMPQESKDIGPYHIHLRHLQLPKGVAYKTKLTGIILHQHDLSGAAGGELIADAAGAGKEVQDGAFFEIEIVFQDCEKCFLGHIGRRTGLQRARRSDPVFPVFATYYTHG